nr:uncharacterized mitochondrial protein AtMg00810-like [Tanacetum cinerariifolium]
VKSAFLYGTIEEEVYVYQPLGFEDLDYPDKVYKVVNALYGLHQAPKAWYETLANYLLENSFQRGKIDQTLFIQRQRGDILLVQIYVDDIIFGSTNKDLCKAFEKLMKDKFQMSSMGELTFFLGLQVKQKQDGIFICHDKYVAEILRKFGLTDGKSASTPIYTEKPLRKDLDGEDVDVHTYRTMIGSLMYLTSSRLDIMFAVCACPCKGYSSTKFYMYPRFLQLMIRAQVGDLSSHTTKYSSSALTQKVFANMRRAGKGFSRVNTPLFEGAASVDVDDVPAAVDEPSIPSPTPATQPPCPSQDLPSTSQVQPTPPPSIIAQPPLPQQQQSSHDAEISMDLLHTLLETCTNLTRRVKHLEQDKIAQTLEIKKLKQRVKKLERRNKLKVSRLRRLKKVGTSQRVDISDDTVMDDVTKQGRIIASMDADMDVTLKDVADVAKEVVVDAEIKESADVQRRQAKSQAQIYQIDLEHVDKVLSMQDDEVGLAELQEVVEVVTTTKLMTKVVTVASATITAADTRILAATITVVAPTLTTVPSAARRRKGVVIRDPEETATPSIIVHSESKSKDKGKGILVEEPKPFKKQAQIKQDEAYARELEVELNKIINWDDVIDQVQRKEKEDNVVMWYQALKRKPQTEAQARKNMMIYLRNMTGFKMDYFKGIKYDDIRPIFEKYFNSNVAFLENTKEQMEKEDSRELKRANESQAKKAAKKQKLDEEVACNTREIFKF